MCYKGLEGDEKLREDCIDMVAVIQREMMQSLIAEVGTNSKAVLEAFGQNLTDGYCKWYCIFLACLHSVEVWFEVFLLDISRETKLKNGLRF